MCKQTKILLLIPHLRGGGAARVTVNLARGFSGLGYRVHLAAVTDSYGETELAPGIALHGLGVPRVRWGVPAILQLVREIRPQIILSNMAHLNLLVLALRPAFPQKTRIVVREDGGTRRDRLSPVLRYLSRHLYCTANAVLCQGKVMREKLSDELGRTDLLRILPNPVDLQQVRAAEQGASLWNGAGPNILAMGRLASEKGFDLLLQAFADLLAEFPEAQLTVLGEGPEHEFLTALARSLDIETHVCFAGQAANPQAWFAGASAFVLSSRRDALPNALLEAAGAGLPIVATPAEGDIPRLLKNQQGAWLASAISIPALTTALAEALRVLTPGQRFAHPWIEPFDLPRAIHRYDALIQSLIGSYPQ